MKNLISRRSLIKTAALAAPALILPKSLGAQIVRPCGPGGFCLPPSACRAPFFRDYSQMLYPKTIINPDSVTPGLPVANAFEVRRENNIAGITYGFTETDDNLGMLNSQTIVTWTSTNDVDGPWTYAGVALTRTPGGSDDHNLVCPSTINIPGTAGIGGPWGMYYGAEDSGGNWNISLALSPTMQAGSWTKFGSIINGAGQSDPCVLVLGPNQFICYYAPNYPGGNAIWYNTSTDGLNWSFGGVALAAPSPGDWDYGQHSIFEPTVIFNKYCFYEMLYDTADEHNSTGLGSQAIGQATSSSPFGPFTRAPNPLPSIVYGIGGNCRLIEKNGLAYVFGDQFDEIPGVFGVGGVGLAFLPDPP